MSFRVDAVDVTLDGVEVLKAVTLELTERRIGVIGDNGSGKSTLARLLNGLTLPTRGRVLMDGLDTRSDAAAIRRKVGFVFQNADHQLIMPTVREDVAFSLTVRGVAQLDADRRASAALDRLGIAHVADRACHVLSGGEKQLAALAGVLVTEPDVIVFDEPTTMLDRRNAARMMQTIAALPCRVVVVTHHVELLTGFDRVVVLDQGRVVADGPPDAAVAAYLKTHAS